MNPFANTLLHSSCAAARGGPKMRRPARAKRSTTPRSSGSSGPTTVRSIALALGEREQRVGIAGIDVARARATAAMPAFPGAQTMSRHDGLAREAPRERMFAAAAADNQDPHVDR